MKRLSLLFMILALILPITTKAQDRNGKEGNGKGSYSQPVRQASRPAAHVARQPVVINMSRPSSGGHNSNYPAQQAAPQQRQKPSYGQMNWSQPARQTQPQVRANVSFGQPAVQRYSVKSYASPGMKAANAVHHHPYTQGYVRKKLQKIGVTVEPSYITDRAEIIHTDRAHSVIEFPKHGPDKMLITATAISPRHFNDEAVRDHMALISGDEWHLKVQDLNRVEIQVGHHYWHQENGFNYCHYLDNYGYHWYGWYVGNQFFWNRYFNGRWWWYDTDFDRWCFWNNGFWWWQDPYHVGDLYCYNNTNYIPCNSDQDQVVVTAPAASSLQAYNSPDGTRIVKVDSTTQDAFLYDTANPPSFEPIYLASGVKNVQYSDTSNGRPLEIVLTLNDGSFDMFDGQGNPYNPGAFDADQAAQSNANTNTMPDSGAPSTYNPPPDGGTPPTSAPSAGSGT